MRIIIPDINSLCRIKHTASVRATAAGQTPAAAAAIIGCVDRAEPGKPSYLLHKSVEGGVRAVFVSDNVRYTLDHDVYAAGVQVWFRPEGTAHPSVKAKAFVDANLDGVVDGEALAGNSATRYTSEERHVFQQQYNLLLYALAQGNATCVGQALGG